MHNPWHPSRRQFLQTSAAIGAGWLAGRPQAWAQESVSLATLVTGKHAGLEVLKNAPLVAQTPLRLLGERITTADRLFVRNNQDMAGASTLEPFAGDDWNISLTGLLNREATISLPELRSLPQTSVEMVLQCSGNRRAKFSEIKPTEGTQWGSGGIGNVKFGGVKLTEVLRKLGIEPKAEAWYLTADGRDAPKAGEEDFEHSTPLADVLETALLALTLNDQPLPRIHGGPVRLVIPGYYATVCAKWLTQLRFEAGESRNKNHASRYRTPNSPIVPGSEFNFTLPNSTPTWRMKVATLVTGVVGNTTQPTVSGWVWNDGRAKIASVLVTDDSGETWRPCQLKLNAESPFGWSSWTCEVQRKPLPTEYWFRAIDGLGRSQPLDGVTTWNPHGYEWNVVERVKSS